MGFGLSSVYTRISCTEAGSVVPAEYMGGQTGMCWLVASPSVSLGTRILSVYAVSRLSMDEQ